MKIKVHSRKFRAHALVIFAESVQKQYQISAGQEIVEGDFFLYFRYPDHITGIYDVISGCKMSKSRINREKWGSHVHGQFDVTTILSHHNFSWKINEMSGEIVPLSCFSVEWDNPDWRWDHTTPPSSSPSPSSFHQCHDRIASSTVSVTSRPFCYCSLWPRYHAPELMRDSECHPHCLCL